MSSYLLLASFFIFQNYDLAMHKYTLAYIDDTCSFVVLVVEYLLVFLQYNSTYFLFRYKGDLNHSERRCYKRFKFILISPIKTLISSLSFCKLLSVMRGYSFTSSNVFLSIFIFLNNLSSHLKDLY